ncbi:MAG: S-formylglutathione hydrolase [Myxococcota bacterium]
MEVVSRHRCFGGTLTVYAHQSAATRTRMTFSAFVPPGDGPFPIVTFLSGLTCTEQNFTTKAGAYRSAAERGLVVVAPDTSPRGEGGADDPAYDLGQGASFYVDATEAPWAPHFRMHQYVTEELYELCEHLLPIDPARHGLFGHSMGGHGALVLGLRHPDQYRSLSAFAPICHPTACPWGEKAFAAYLGSDRSTWAAWDATERIRAAGDRSAAPPILVDQGLADGFLAEQLRPDDLASACAAVGQRLQLRKHEGYDHSYYFIATFVDDHLAHHAALLG